LDKLKVGIVGCGAVTEIAHLPALTKHPLADIYGIVDKNEGRAKVMAEKFCLFRYFTDYNELFDKVDIAIIALPNYLHAKPTIDFLEQDVHILCEKPMAISTKECQAMIKAENKSKAKLMIGHNRRFMSNVILSKTIIDNEILGNIINYECKVGSVYRWPTQTGFYFKKDKAGGGVLIDMGSHILDLVIWFFGEVNDVQYIAKDVVGKGVEDNVWVSLIHDNSIKGSITLSRTELLENTLLIRGDKGWIKIGIFDTTLLEFFSEKAKISSKMGQLNVKTKKNDPFRDQFTHFVKCIRTNSEPLISGIDGMKVVKVVEECYKQAL
jgi:UDP-N-acetylglucosamine 3-dehydrogenase